MLNHITLSKDTVLIYNQNNNSNKQQADKPLDELQKNGLSDDEIVIMGQ